VTEVVEGNFCDTQQVNNGHQVRQTLKPLKPKDQLYTIEITRSTQLSPVSFPLIA
jgi:hypothetical protein